MVLRIANPAVVKKVEALARATGLSKTEVVEKAVDRLLTEHAPGEQRGAWEQFDELLAQLDRIPDLPKWFDPLDWDERGLPR